MGSYQNSSLVGLADGHMKSAVDGDTFTEPRDLLTPQHRLFSRVCVAPEDAIRCRSRALQDVK
jgi:hypothetical protein